MSRAMRMTAVGLALPGCLLIAAHAHAQAAPAQPATTAPPASTDKIVRVTADLAAGTFDRVLPFDVPFFIVGEAPEGTVRLFVQDVEHRKREPPPTEGWEPAEPAQWKPEAPATANQAFLVFLREPLDAERYYRFRFTFVRQPSAEQTQKFRDAAVSIFDEELKTFFTTETLISGAEARRKLADLLPAITRDPKWTAAPGSFFDTEVGSTARLDQVLSEVRESLAGQAERREILKTFATVRIGLFESLGALRANAALKTIIGAAGKIDDAGIRELVKLDAEGLALVTTTMSPAEIDLLAAGGVMGDLADVWRAADVTARATNYQQLLRRLRQLEHFVRAVSDTDGAARPAIETVTSPAIVAAVATLNAGPLRTAIQQSTRLSLDMGRLAEALQMRDQGIVRLTNEVTVVFQDVRFIVGFERRRRQHRAKELRQRGRRFVLRGRHRPGLAVCRQQHLLPAREQGRSAQREGELQPPVRPHRWRDAELDRGRELHDEDGPVRRFLACAGSRNPGHAVHSCRRRRARLQGKRSQPAGHEEVRGSHVVRVLLVRHRHRPGPPGAWRPIQVSPP